MASKSQAEKPEPGKTGQSTRTGDVPSPRTEEPPYQVSWATMSVDDLKKALQIGEECGCNPRNSRKAHAQGIAAAMSDGDWENGIPDIVCLCEHGGVSNGRHRCLGAVAAGVPLTGWVARNVPKAVIRHADIGMRRTPGDVLLGHGVKTYRTALGAAVRLLKLYDDHRDVHWSRWSTVRYPAYKIGDLYVESYSGVTDTVDLARQIESGTNCTPSAGAAFAFLLDREGGRERLAEVAYGLAGGTPDVQDVLAVTRNRLSREAKNRGRKADANRAPYELGLLITAVLTRERDRTGRFTFGPTSPMPALAFTDKLPLEGDGKASPAEEK